MILSLDTNALIEVVNGGRPQVRRAFDAALATGHELWVSVLVAHELRFGVAFGGRRGEHEAVEEMLASLPVAEFNADDSAGATAVRLDLERRGLRIGAMDTLIAGQAMARGWAIVTANVHEFNRVAGLQVIDWTAGPKS